MQLEPGQIAVVTGAASGIGRALALAFRAAGLQVVATDMNASALQALQTAALADGREAQFDTVVLDVRDAAALEALAAQLETRGGAAVLCNNAGVMVPRTLWEHSDAEWRWLMDVNVNGVMNGLRAFIPRMLARGTPAHVVNTCSMGGFLTSPILGGYSATKFAVRALTESLLYDLQARSANIGVSMLAPGAVNTGIFERRAEAPETEDAMTAGAREMMRQGVAKTGSPPAEIANLVLAAINADRYFVFPHPYLSAITDNAAAIASLQNPRFDWAATWKTDP